MAQTDLQGFPIPDPDAPNNVPEDLLDFGNAVEKTVIQRYATLAARNAANPNPDDGEVCYVESEKAYYVRLAGAWRVAYSDTGWIDIPLASGSSGYVMVTAKPQVRIKNGMLLFRGDVKPATGNFVANTTNLIGQMPFAVSFNSVNTVRPVIGPAGGPTAKFWLQGQDITLHLPAAAIYIALSGASGIPVD